MVGVLIETWRIFWHLEKVFLFFWTDFWISLIRWLVWFVKVVIHTILEQRQSQKKWQLIRAHILTIDALKIFAQCKNDVKWICILSECICNVEPTFRFCKRYQICNREIRHLWDTFRNKEKFNRLSTYVTKSWWNSKSPIFSKLMSFNPMME